MILVMKGDNIIMEEDKRMILKLQDQNMKLNEQMEFCLKQIEKLIERVKKLEKDNDILLHGMNMLVKDKIKELEKLKNEESEKQYE